MEKGKEDNTVRLWDTASGRELRKLSGHISAVQSVAFSTDGKLLVSGSVDGTIKFWDVKIGNEVINIPAPTNNSSNILFSQDGNRIISGFKTIWDINKGLGLRTIERPSEPDEIGTLTPDGRLLATGNKVITIWDTPTGSLLHTLGKAENEIKAIPATFSPDGRLLASIYRSTVNQAKFYGTIKPAQVNPNDPNGIKAAQDFARTLSLRLFPEAARQVKIWDTATGQELRSLTIVSPDQYGFVNDQTSAVTFSPDGRLLAACSAAKPVVQLWDVAAGKELHRFESGTMMISSLAFSGDGRLLASAGMALPNMAKVDDKTGRIYYNNTIRIWDVAAGKEFLTLIDSAPIINAVALNRNGQLIAAATGDNVIKLWDVKSGKILRTISTPFGRGGAVSFSPDDKLLASAGSDGTRIWDVKTGELLISLISLGEGADWLAVTPDGLFDGSPAAWKQLIWRFNNNTFDYASIETFYNEFYYPGLLTEIFSNKRPKAPQDISQKDRRQPKLNLSVAKGQDHPSAAVSSNSVKVNVKVAEALAGARDIRLFRNGSLVKVWRGETQVGKDLEERVAITSGQNKFTAYAFNKDNVKSTDVELLVMGEENLRWAGTLYVLAIGINEYSNKEFNLRYAVPDAEDFATELKNQQDKLKLYDHTEIIYLKDGQATKKNILDKLAELSKKMQPEDAVAVFFAGHGTIGSCQLSSAQTINAKDRFYLVPYDLGYSGAIPNQCSQQILNAVTKNSISDEELEVAFESINASQILLIIDACNSGQALESEEKRRGPMNSRGLAQLAYEKGMYILTAAQSFQEAKADRKVAKGHGYLTYALVDEGLKSLSADAQPKDGQVLLREWLDYAVNRVPQMQRAGAEEIRQFVKRQGGKAPEEDAQQPRVFYRRETDVKPMIVAKP